jgi:hypothetical protein
LKSRAPRAKVRTPDDAAAEIPALFRTEELAARYRALAQMWEQDQRRGIKYWVLMSREKVLDLEPLDGSFHSLMERSAGIISRRADIDSGTIRIRTSETFDSVRPKAGAPTRTLRVRRIYFNSKKVAADGRGELRALRDILEAQSGDDYDFGLVSYEEIGRRHGRSVSSIPALIAQAYIPGEKGALAPVFVETDRQKRKISQTLRAMEELDGITSFHELGAKGRAIEAERKEGLVPGIHAVNKFLAGVNHNQRLRGRVQLKILHHWKLMTQRKLVYALLALDGRGSTLELVRVMDGARARAAVE